VVIGGGVGGLVAALELACAGQDVTLLERAATPGGKLREVVVAGRLDAGPTVFTMRWIFEAIFADAGAALSDLSAVVRVWTEVLAQQRGCPGVTVRTWPFRRWRDRRRSATWLPGTG